MNCLFTFATLSVIILYGIKQEVRRMEMKLAENIRAFRKEWALTQEQLSEVLGVTAGAVYKWEAKLSVPDLDLIVEMADFFDVSVDVLLGYTLQDNHIDKTVKRLREYRRRKDFSGLTEAEKALKKYPHSFVIVRECAALYRAFGFESGDKELFGRALELLERSRLLIGQNEDPEISEQTINGKIAETYLGLGEYEKAIELFKKNNAGGLYDHTIGHILAVRERTEEAVPFLSEAFAKIIAELCDTVTGYMNVYSFRGDHASAQAILRLVTDFFSGLGKDGKPNFLDKVNSAFLAALAGSEFISGKPEKARDTLIKAKKLAEFFDASPSYDESDIRFINRIEGASAHDDIGVTAINAIDKAVEEFGNKDLSALWISIKEQEENK